jgi:hypothetical protein
VAIRESLCVLAIAKNPLFGGKAAQSAGRRFAHDLANLQTGGM